MKKEGITFTVEDAEKTYADANPLPETLQVSVSGCIPGEESLFKYGSEYTANYNFDIYHDAGIVNDGITLKINLKSEIMRNYECPEILNQNFTINKRNAKLVAEDVTIEYNDPEPEIYPVTSTNIIDKDKILPEDYAVYRDGGSDVGNYNINLSLTEIGKTKFENNYQLEIQNGNFVINYFYASLDIKLKDTIKSIIYGNDILD